MNDVSAKRNALIDMYVFPLTEMDDISAKGNTYVSTIEFVNKFLTLDSVITKTAPHHTLLLIFVNHVSKAFPFLNI